LARFVPKNVSDELWKPLASHCSRAFRANAEETIYLRLGKGKSLYLELVATQMGARLVNLLEYESGSGNLLHRLADQTSLLVGRTSDCAVKIVNPIVSRRHVELSLDGNVLVVTDLGSSNGTYFHSDGFGFDIDPYLQSRPLDGAEDRTLDAIHEAFGPNLDDFLRRYSQKKDAQS
jgi:hypothetical protein